jgi:hypothetical protein
MLEQGYAATCIPLLIPGGTFYDDPFQHVILVNFSYLAITLSKADVGSFTLLGCCGVRYLPCGRKDFAWNKQV